MPLYLLTVSRRRHIIKLPFLSFPFVPRKALVLLCRVDTILYCVFSVPLRLDVMLLMKWHVIISEDSMREIYLHAYGLHGNGIFSPNSLDCYFGVISCVHI